MSSCYAGVSNENNNLLPIVPVKVRAPNSGETFVTHAFLDTGSTTSFVTDNLINKLNVKGAPIVDVAAVTRNPILEERSAKVIHNLEISGFSEALFFKLQPILSISNIPVQPDNIPSQKDISQFSEFNGLHIPSVNADVDLLIGNDIRHILQPYEIINSAERDYALRSDIGLDR